MRRFNILSDKGDLYFGAEEEIRRLPNEYKNPILKQIEAASQGKKMEAITVPTPELEKAGWLTEDAMKQVMEQEGESIHDAPEDEDERPRKRVMRRAPQPKTVTAHEILEPFSARVSRCEAMIEEMISKFPEPHKSDCDSCPLRPLAEKVIDKALEKI